MTLSQSLTRHDTKARRRFYHSPTLMAELRLRELQHKAEFAPKGQRRRARRELQAVLHGALRRVVEGGQ